MQDEELFDDEPIEAYCVRCRETVFVENPVAVWTRKGVPAMRGECSVCGGTVFRMGKTDAHEALNRPSAVKVANQSNRMKLPQETVYVNFAAPDTEIAARIADDLQKLGIACWLHEAAADAVSWAGGVHPSLSECLRMIVVLSTATPEDAGVEAAWQFFRDKNKPIVIAQVAPVDPPDALRRRPRFDFTSDYKRAFRQMLQSLAG